MEGAMSYERDVESLKATELRLGLPGTDEISSGTIRGIKRTLDGSNEDGRSETKSPKDAAGSTATEDEEEDEVAPPKAKAQVVGWPPVRSYRKNTFQARKAAEAEAAASGGTLVKVSMDGAPYLRKIELKTYKGYKELREALESMFKSFSLGKISAAVAVEGGRSGGSEYAITYEDKDRDWMLVGDVPWGMFTSSCKRLRIMRGSEARGFGSNQ